MKHTSVGQAAVLDADGKVVASSGSQEIDWATAPQVQKVPLPEGGYLATVAPSPDPSWSRFARAFVHEARSPLNALAIYLELIGTRHGASHDGKVDPGLERVLVKAQDQVRRVDELLRTFSDLWAPRGEVTNLAAIVRAAARFSEHEAIRRGFQLKQQICERALISTPSLMAAAAVVSLLGGALQAPAESVVTLTLDLVNDGAAVRLNVSVQLPPGQEKELLHQGESAFRLLGATCTRDATSLTVLLSTAAAEDAAA